MARLSFALCGTCGYLHMHSKHCQKGWGDTNLAASLRCQSGDPPLSTPKGFKAVREGGSVLGRMILIIIPTPFTT